MQLHVTTSASHYSGHTNRSEFRLSQQKKKALNKREMRTVVCLVVLALAVVSAEEKSLVGPDVELLSKCTDSLTTLMNSKAKAITGLNGIAAHLKDDKPPAKTGDSAKPAVKPDAPVAAKNGPKDGADKQKVVPKAAAPKEEELGEWREPVESAHWAGLKSLSHKVLI